MAPKKPKPKSKVTKKPKFKSKPKVTLFIPQTTKTTLRRLRRRPHRDLLSLYTPVTVRLVRLSVNEIERWKADVQIPVPVVPKLRERKKEGIAKINDLLDKKLGCYRMPKLHKSLLASSLKELSISTNYLQIEVPQLKQDTIGMMSNFVLLKKHTPDLPLPTLPKDVNIRKLLRLQGQLLPVPALEFELEGSSGSCILKDIVATTIDEGSEFDCESPELVIDEDQDSHLEPDTDEEINVVD